MIHMEARCRRVLCIGMFISMALSAGTASAATTIWKVTAEGGRVQTRHSDNGNSDPNAHVTFDDTQSYRGQIEFNLVLTKDGDFTHTGFGTYSEASWHLQGVNGGDGAFSCDPTVSTTSPFDVSVTGYSTNGAAFLHLGLAAQESNQDTDCGAKYTAFGTTSTALAESLTAVGGDHLRLTGIPVAPFLRSHTVTDSGTTQTTRDDEWHFSATCSGDCLPDPVKVRQQQKDDAAKAVAEYENALEWDHAATDALGCFHHNKETRYACLAYIAKQAYDEAMLANARTLVKDPPDKHFKKIVHPRPLKLRRLGIPHGAATDALLANYARVVGLSRALLSTINRADGAAVAASRRWTLRQNQAARVYASQIVTLLRRQESLAVHAKRSLIQFHLMSRHNAAGLADANSRHAVSHLILTLQGLH